MISAGDRLTPHIIGIRAGGRQKPGTLFDSPPRPQPREATFTEIEDTMPRVPAEARAARARLTPSPLKPSPHLGDAERKAWRSLLAACPAGHLTERDRPLVETWCTLSVTVAKLAATVASGTALELIDRDSAAGQALNKTEALSRSLSVISNRLKIAPLADHSEPHRAAIRKAPGQGESPRGLVRVA